jgi:hypothetical protein
VTAPEDREPTAAELEAEADEHWQAAYEAMYGTFEEQAADAAVAEAEATVSGAFAGYLTDTYFISGPDDLGDPEAGL